MDIVVMSVFKLSKFYTFKRLPPTKMLIMFENVMLDLFAFITLCKVFTQTKDINLNDF